MKKTTKIIALALTAAMTIPMSMSAFAADITPAMLPNPVPPERSLQVTESLVGDILDNVVLGENYGSAHAKSEYIIDQATNNYMTGGYSDVLISNIADNSIRYYEDMYFRVDYYMAEQERVRSMIDDLILGVRYNRLPYDVAVNEAYKRINYEEGLYDTPINSTLSFARQLLSEAVLLRAE